MFDFLIGNGRGAENSESNGPRTEAKTGDDVHPLRQPPHIGLALGGGAARGFAHIGIVKALIARGLKPDPFFTSDTWKLITTAGFDEGLSRLGEADWILEAVVERLDIKRTLPEKVDAARRAGSIVSSNTSGIPIAALA